VLINITNRAETFRRRMATFDPVCPELFVYSRDDTITDPKWLEAVAKDRSDLHGSDVRMARFVGSEHVLHMRAHPEAYAEVWQSFFADKLGCDLPAPATAVRKSAGRGRDEDEDDEIADGALVCVVTDL